MRARSIAVAAVILLSCGLTTAPAGAAGSAPSTTTSVTTFSGSNCPSNSLCLYRDYNYSGGGIALRAGDSLPWLGDQGFNDRMSAWSNDTGVTCVWTEDSYGSGLTHDMYNGYRVNVLDRENDTASAVYC